MTAHALRLPGLVLAGASLMLAGTSPSARQAAPPLVIVSPELQPLASAPGTRALRIDRLSYETAQGRVLLPDTLTAGAPVTGTAVWSRQTVMPDGRQVTVTVAPQGTSFLVSFRASPSDGITRWGFAIESEPSEYYTGLMERVVDGPQQASWAPGITPALNLRGQVVDMLVKPTTSVYAPFFLSSRGYAVLARTDWPGRYDFASTDPARVAIEFEGPAFDMTIYTARTPAALVQAHAIDAGPPFLPPAWLYSPWRWRDEHRQRATYYDGTPVTAPFNAEVLEDVLMMQAFGIPNSVYWIDRPWGTGTPWGYDDFEIDGQRLPRFGDMVKWLEARNMKTVLWIAPFFQGRMAEEAHARGYTYPGQTRPANGNNYPMVDITNPDARKYWQDGIGRLLALGVAGFKLDRGEENIPDDGPHRTFDGRTIRENRNTYIALAAKAAHDVAKSVRGEDFFVMPRAAYTGASPYSVFWGGDIGGTQEGLRASIVAVQRSAVMGYPNWGSDTCGYNQQLMEQEVCTRWLAFSAFTPIMEVGPTRNLGFWNLPREPQYDEVLIAAWRLYARVHERLKDYSYQQGQLATKTGMPIVRPLFLADPAAPEAWSQWWTYLYGPDIVVSPVWEKGQRTQQVYLPAGHRWRNAWAPGEIHQGGQTLTVPAPPHQIPIFVREGSSVDFGDLDREWEEAQAAARQRPDLRALDAEVAAWVASSMGGGQQ